MCKLMLAAVIALSGIGWAQTAWPQSANPYPTNDPTEKAEDAFRRVTERAPEPATRPVNTQAADAREVREALGTVTQAAVNPGGFEELIAQFSASDRSRLSRNQQIISAHPMLDARIAQFRSDWKARYNQEFKIMDKDTVYGAAFASVRLGVSPEGARLASEKIYPQGNGPAPASDEIRDRDQKIATVSIAGTSNAPAIEIPLVREFTGWKINIPDTYSVQEMHDALLTKITDLDEHRDLWPADINEAYRIVTQRVLMAVLNIEPSISAQPIKAMPNQPITSPTEDRILNPNAVR